MAGLTCTAERVLDSPVLRVAVAGELDVTTAGVLGSAVTAAAAESGVSELQVDQQELTFCDVAGITALLTARQRATGRRLGFRVVHARGVVQRVLTLTGVLRSLTGYA